MHSDQMTTPPLAARPERLQAAIRALSALLDEPGAIGTDLVTVALLRHLMCQLNLVRLDGTRDIAVAPRVAEPVPTPRRRGYERLNDSD